MAEALAADRAALARTAQEEQVGEVVDPLTDQTEAHREVSAQEEAVADRRAVADHRKDLEASVQDHQAEAALQALVDRADQVDREDQVVPEDLTEVVAISNHAWGMSTTGTSTAKCLKIWPHGMDVGKITSVGGI